MTSPDAAPVESPRPNVPTVAVSPSALSLRARLAMLVAVVVASVVGSGFYIQLRVFERQVEQDLRQAAHLAAQGIADDIEVQGTLPTPAHLNAQLQQYVDLSPVQSATVLALEPPTPDWQASTSTTPRDEEIALARAAFRQNAVVWGRGQGPYQTVAMPVQFEERTLGAVAVTVSLDPVLQMRRRGRLIAFWFTAATVLLLTLLVDALARPLVHRPIATLLATMRRVGEGDLAARAAIARRDELGTVATGLNDMLDRMQQLHDSLQDRVDEATETLRRRNDDLVASYERTFALREALARAEQTAAAGQTAANLAHQIGTPLNLISGYVQMMIEENAGREPRSLERLRNVEEQIRKVTSFVRATLEAVRNPVVRSEPVFPAEVLRRISEVARPRLAAAGIALDLDVTGDLPWMLGDVVQLELALLNLVNNSLDAMPEGGTIHIRAAARGLTTHIEISDTGHGIPEELLPRIFDPWVTTKPAGQGTGLGLAITRDVVVAHGGAIGVRSAPGEGTVFVIELPGKAGAPALQEA